MKVFPCSTLSPVAGNDVKYRPVNFFFLSHRADPLNNLLLNEKIFIYAKFLPKRTFTYLKYLLFFCLVYTICFYISFDDISFNSGSIKCKFVNSEVLLSFACNPSDLQPLTDYH